MIALSKAESISRYTVVKFNYEEPRLSELSLGPADRLFPSNNLTSSKRSNQTVNT